MLSVIYTQVGVKESRGTMRIDKYLKEIPIAEKTSWTKNQDSNLYKGSVQRFREPIRTFDSNR